MSSMMGSGIYTETITREIVCNERCEDCDQEGKKCDAIWEEDVETDDNDENEKNLISILEKTMQLFRDEKVLING